MGMVPKGPAGDAKKVRDIDTAPSKMGRPSGLGYNPATGEHHQTGQRDASETNVFDVIPAKGYSEARFYTKSTNEHNHGEMLRVRVPQGIDSQIYAAVNDIAEYRSQQDFWRDAAVHRLEYLQKRYSISEEARRLLELERMTADSERRNTDIKIMRATVANLNDKLTEAWDALDYGMLAKELEEAEELVNWMREPYCSQVQTILKDWNDRSRQKIAEYQRALDD